MQLETVRRDMKVVNIMEMYIDDRITLESNEIRAINIWPNLAIDLSLIDKGTMVSHIATYLHRNPLPTAILTVDLRSRERVIDQLIDVELDTDVISISNIPPGIDWNHYQVIIVKDLPSCNVVSGGIIKKLRDNGYEGKIITFS
jgi:hypothetical protein